MRQQEIANVYDFTDITINKDNEFQPKQSDN